MRAKWRQWRISRFYDTRSPPAYRKRREKSSLLLNRHHTHQYYEAYRGCVRALGGDAQRPGGKYAKWIPLVTISGSIRVGGLSGRLWQEQSAIRAGELSGCAGRLTGRRGQFRIGTSRRIARRRKSAIPLLESEYGRSGHTGPSYTSAGSSHNLYVAGGHAAPRAAE
jgi:hypothetical protein